ncbi:hypothetical protein FA95DRAFT_1559675 [Auriscalpium vulgare]|uniref:Uncharacterized protein n=1 Tax=Auriscalpium vulgare TaxID=40419 RepID=A0ACB8RRS8_9AGAM|nr:hypothetical protein FA95DRAFT_1559675 [Auriscalpium vulgare]
MSDLVLHTLGRVPTVPSASQAVQKLVKHVCEHTASGVVNDVSSDSQSIPPALVEAVSLIEARRKAEARANASLGSKAHLIAHLVRACIEASGLAVMLRERVAISLPKPLASDALRLTGAPPTYAVVQLLGLRAYAPNTQSDSSGGGRIDTSSSKAGPANGGSDASLEDPNIDSPLEGPEGDASLDDPENDDVRGYLQYFPPPPPPIDFEAVRRKYPNGMPIKVFTGEEPEDDMSDESAAQDSPSFSDKDLTLDDSDCDPAANKDCHILLDNHASPIVFGDLIFADQDVIFQAMSSALYQRFNLGVEGPILGLTFSEGALGLWLHAFIGSLKSESEESGMLPAVHVFRWEFDSASQVGSFDLSNPAFVLSLSEVLQGLDTVDGFRELDDTPPLEWRADRGHFNGSGSGWNVGTWVNSNSTEALASEDYLETPAPGDVASFISADTTPGNDAYLWLMDRGCLLDSFLPTYRGRYDVLQQSCFALDLNPSYYPKAIPFFKFYDEATTCGRWPQAWTQIGVSATPDDLLDHLLTSTESRDASNDMDRTLVQLLHQGLVGILRASYHSQPAFWEPANGSQAAFHSFHEILAEFVACAEVNDSDAPLVYCFFNQKIRLPRNDRADGRFVTDLDPNFPYSVSSKQCLNMETNYTDLEWHTDAYRSRGFTPKQWRERVVINLHQAHCTPWLELGDKGVAMRDSRSPRLSVCDAILAAKSPVIPSSSVDPAAKAGLILLERNTPESTPPQADGTSGQEPALDDIQHSFLLPLLVLQHDKDFEHNVVGAAKLRMHLTASVKFLGGALNVFDFPVFGILSRGPLAIVACAWAPEPNAEQPADPLVHIFERSCRVFDLSEPIGAFDYAAFLAWVRVVHAKTLLDKLGDGKWDTFLASLVRDGKKVSGWAMGEK